MSFEIHTIDSSCPRLWWTAIQSTKTQIPVEHVSYDIYTRHLWVICWGHRHGNTWSVPSRIYRLSGRINREPKQLLIDPNDKFISVMYRITVWRRGQGKVVLQLPWAWERRCQWGGSSFELRPKASIVCWECASWQRACGSVNRPCHRAQVWVSVAC